LKVTFLLHIPYQINHGDWVVEMETKRVGILKQIGLLTVSIRFGNAAAIRHPDLVKLAPLDFREDDLLAMQHLAVGTGDRDWFDELGGRLKLSVH
jgi:hypothetical protein